MRSSSRNTAAELVGYRFIPTEQELVSHYLKRKMQGKGSHFPEIECFKHEPWDLHAMLVPNQDMEEGFFFSPRHNKYTNIKRASQAGYWKIIGKTRYIKARHSQAVIGFKRTLTFYLGPLRNSHKTNWVMHEYDIAETELGSKPKQNGDFVLCRLKSRSDPSANKKDSSICDEPGLKSRSDPSANKKDSSICDEPDPDSDTAFYFGTQAAADDMIAEQEENLFKELQENLQMIFLGK